MEHFLTYCHVPSMDCLLQLSIHSPSKSVPILICAFTKQKLRHQAEPPSLSVAELRYKPSTQVPILLSFPLNHCVALLRFPAWAAGRMMVPFIEGQTAHRKIHKCEWEEEACGRDIQMQMRMHKTDSGSIWLKTDRGLKIS